MDTNQTNSPASADLIIKHVWIVTMDEERRIFRDGAIAVKGDRITGVGPSSDVLQKFRADTVIDGTDKFVITPGLVNGHVHVTGEPITREPGS